MPNIGDDVCPWSEDEDGNWWTTCKECFVFTDGGPKENKMSYCCYCGLVLKSVRYRADEGQDEELERATENGIEMEIDERREDE